MSATKQEYGWFIMEPHDGSMARWTPKQESDRFWCTADNTQFWCQVSLVRTVGFHENSIYCRRVESGEGYELVKPEDYFHPNLSEFTQDGVNWFGCDKSSFAVKLRDWLIAYKNIVGVRRRTQARNIQCVQCGQEISYVEYEKRWEHKETHAFACATTVATPPKDNPK